MSPSNSSCFFRFVKSRVKECHRFPDTPAQKCTADYLPTPRPSSALRSLFAADPQPSLCTISSPLTTVLVSVMNSQEDTFDSLEAEVGALETEVGDLQARVVTLSPEDLKVLVSKQQELHDKTKELHAKTKELHAKTKELLNKKLSASQGKFFAATKRVWKSVNHTLRREPSGDFSAENWGKLVRETVDFDCLAMSKVRKRCKLYQSTKEHAEDSQFESISVKSLRSSTATADTKRKIWSRDVAGNANNEYAEGAHLLPAGKSDHVDWFRIGGAVVGLDEKNSDITTMLKATRGCQNPDKKRRFEFEGVLHFVSNRLYLAQQKHLIDGENPKMLVVPLLQLDQIHSWAGTGYDAVVLVGEPDSETPVDNPMTDEDVHEAFVAARMNNDDIKTAEPQQVIHAAGILKDGVVALAEMLLSMSENELNAVQAVDQKSTERLRKARQNLTNSGGGVNVPDVINDNIAKDDCRVMLVSFSAHSEDEPPHHVAPDPLLLLLKAANVFGRLTGMDFLANGVIPTLDSESDIEQMEVYAALLDMVPRKTNSPTGMLVGAH